MYVDLPTYYPIVFQSLQTHISIWDYFPSIEEHSFLFPLVTDFLNFQ